MAVVAVLLILLAVLSVDNISYKTGDYLAFTGSNKSGLLEQKSRLTKLLMRDHKGYQNSEIKTSITGQPDPKTMSTIKMVAEVEGMGIGDPFAASASNSTRGGPKPGTVGTGSGGQLVSGDGTPVNQGASPPAAQPKVTPASALAAAKAPAIQSFKIFMAYKHGPMVDDLVLARVLMLAR
ncbi:MAG: hypothetical protein EBX33_10170, partial [Synechococcaceae bacterium WB8_1A_041]|nr:hypothetical protein [Synechococcaceae bacterium WB8_1A_041]